MPTEPHSRDPRTIDLRAIVERATRAPSSHNSQPWRFRMRDGAIDLRADRARSLPVNDPEGRELVISCGAALLHLRVGLAAAGVGVRVEVLPEAGDPDLLARVTFSGADAPESFDPRLESAIAQRATHRGELLRRSVSGAVVEALSAIAAREGAALDRVRDLERRRALARLVGEGDRAFWHDRAWRRELAQWMQPHARGEGLGVPRLAAPIVHATVRAIDLGALVGRFDVRAVERAETLLVLSTERDDVASWLAAGQALAHLLLRAAAEGLSAGFLNQPAQVPALRPELAALVNRPAPQIVMRLGYPAGEIMRSSRRPVDDVIDAT